MVRRQPYRCHLTNCTDKRLEVRVPAFDDSTNTILFMHISWFCLNCVTNDADTAHAWFNTLRPRQNGRHFPDDIVKCIFLNKNVWISINISLKFVPKSLLNNIPSLVQIMAWHRPGGKPLSEPMMVSLLTHICAIRPQWVNQTIFSSTQWRPRASRWFPQIWGTFSQYFFWQFPHWCYQSFQFWE